MSESNSNGSQVGAIWLPAPPIAIGGTLALVYALGAIAIYGQLRPAGFDVMQTMPLVPVEQILGARASAASC
jgi:hypothetical protein